MNPIVTKINAIEERAKAFQEMYRPLTNDIPLTAVNCNNHICNCKIYKKYHFAYSGKGIICYVKNLSNSEDEYTKSIFTC